MLTATIVLTSGWQTPGAGGNPYPQQLVINSAITSWDQLAAVATTSTVVGTAIAWIEASTLILKVTQLQAGLEATDTAQGLQRPNDFNASTNAKVWHGVSVL